MTSFPKTLPSFFYMVKGPVEQGHKIKRLSELNVNVFPFFCYLGLSGKESEFHDNCSCFLSR